MGSDKIRTALRAYVQYLSNCQLYSLPLLLEEQNLQRKIRLCIREAIFGIKMTHFYVEMTVNQKDHFLIWRLRFTANLQICFKFAD